jgi:hypothetical protein
MANYFLADNAPRIGIKSRFFVRATAAQKHG